MPQMLRKGPSLPVGKKPGLTPDSHAGETAGVQNELPGGNEHPARRGAWASSSDTPSDALWIELRSGPRVDGNQGSYRVPMIAVHGPFQHVSCLLMGTTDCRPSLSRTMGLGPSLRRGVAVGILLPQGDRDPLGCLILVATEERSGGYRHGIMRPLAGGEAGRGGVGSYLPAG